MAHSLYYFLLRLENPDAEDAEILETVRDESASFFEDNCGENNYHDKIYVVTSTDRFIPFPLEDESGPYDPPKSRTYAELVDEAFLTVASRIVEPGMLAWIQTMSRERWVEDLWRQGANRMAQIYTRIAAEAPSGVTKYDYELSVNAEYFRLFLASCTTPHPPFVTLYSDRNPYKYCAFSLCDENVTPNAILVADIHT